MILNAIVKFFLPGSLPVGPVVGVIGRSKDGCEARGR